MCDPVSALVAGGLVASAAGSGISMHQQNSYAKRTARASQQEVEDELRRQHGFQSRAGQVFNGAVGQMGAPAQADALASATANREAYLRDAAVVSPASGAVPGAVPAVVQSDLARRMAAAAGQAGNQASAFARLGARNDLALRNGTAMADSAARLGEISGASRGSAALLPLAQQAAVNNVRGPSGFGQLLQSAGQLALMGGMSRAPGKSGGAYWRFG